MSIELVPIGTILAVLTSQVIKTAQAAKDVVFEKSFKALSKHLFAIEPVLKELQLKNLNDSKAARHALECLEADVKKASNLVEKYHNCARFYLLLNCRCIVQEVEDVTRDIGRSLAALNLASTEVLSEISDQVTKLQIEMQRVELEASQTQRQIVDKLNVGLQEQKQDQSFANDILEQIARAVGVPVEPSEICRELADFCKEKEEAANRKEMAEVLFLEQVIELLSRAEAAKDYEEVKKQYFQRAQVIEQFGEMEDHIQPFRPFICPISGTVMTDPVSLCTGTTCERAEIEALFNHGVSIDPETGDFLDDLSLRSNFPLKHSIKEWRELNYCLEIRCSKAKLRSNEDLKMEEALNQMLLLIEENPVNKDWITASGLTDTVISTLGSSHNKDVKRKALFMLNDLVKGHSRNMGMLVESQVIDHIVPCLGCDSSLSRPAVELLYELIQGSSGLNASVYRKLSQQSSAVFFLVALLSGSIKESAEIAENVLTRLFSVDEVNVFHAARAGWFKPVVDRVIQGPESTRMSMVRALIGMELIEHNIKKLGEDDIIPPLVSMMSGNAESMHLALSLLVKLCSCKSIKGLIAAAGGAASVLHVLSSSHVHQIIAKCCEVLERLSSNGDGIKFLIDENGSQLELEPIIMKLFAFQQNQIASHNIRRLSLQVVLEICKSDAGLVKKAVLSENGIVLILPLLDDHNVDVREIAIKLLFLFSHHEPQGVLEYLLKPRRLEALVRFLENDDKLDAQIAAVGLVANLPKSEASLTMNLMELGGLDAIMNILRAGKIEVMEKALNALFRFTDPNGVEFQRSVVERGAYPLLMNILKSGSLTARECAAGLIGDLSHSSQHLADATKPTSWLCLRMGGRVSVCTAHDGVCSVNGTFCLLKANALPELVRLVQGRVDGAADEAIRALSTLVRDECPHRGANVLHEVDAVRPLIEVLTWGTDPLKEKALGLLEKVFAPREMVERYGSTARFLLVGLAGPGFHEGSRVGRKAGRVLQQIERYSRSSKSSVSAASG